MESGAEWRLQDMAALPSQRQGHIDEGAISPKGGHLGRLCRGDLNPSGSGTAGMENAVFPTLSFLLLNKGKTSVFPFAASETRKRWPSINQSLPKHL